MRQLTARLFEAISLSDVSPNRLRELGIQGVALDWENTCEPLVRRRPWASRNAIRSRQRRLSWATISRLALFHDTGLRLCVASNSTSDFLGQVVADLAQAGIPIELMQPPSSVWWQPAKKPSPHKLQRRYWQAVLGKLRVEPEHAAMIGDKFRFDIQPALAAGFALAVKVSPLGQDLLAEALVRRRRRDDEAFLAISR